MALQQITYNDISQPLAIAPGAVETYMSTQGSSFGFRNRIINGAMGIWQRGTSGFTTSGNYAADRFLVSSGTSLSAVAQSADVPAGFPYSLSTSGTNVPSVRQYIESKNCTDLVGQSVTISVWIKQTSGAGSNAMYIYLAYANSADTFSGLTQIGSSVNLTTTLSWAQYTATFTNLPSGAANGLALIIGSNSSGTSTFLITGVQLERGSTASAFEYRDYTRELQLCQRYYWKGNLPIMYNFTGSSIAVNSSLSFPVTMRATPTTTIANVTGIPTSYPDSFSGYLNSISSGAAYVPGIGTASAEL
jgi:hypothetical protein